METQQLLDVKYNIF